MLRYFVHRDGAALNWRLRLESPIVPQDDEDEDDRFELVFAGRADGEVEQMFRSLERGSDPYVLRGNAALLHAFTPFANGWNDCRNRLDRDGHEPFPPLRGDKAMALWEKKGREWEARLGHRMPEMAKHLLWLCRTHETLPFEREWLAAVMAANMLFGFSMHYLQVAGNNGE